MIKFARDGFRLFFTITLWIWLIVLIIAGGIIGYWLNYEGGAFLGVIVGLFLWFNYYILGGGLIATFLNMDENLEYQSKLINMLIKYKQKEMRISEPLPNKEEDGSSEVAKNYASKEFNPNKKFCNNCGKENDEKEKKCKDCGGTDFSVL